MMLRHEEQFDVVLVARQRLIEQLKELCKSFQVPSALKIQDPRQSGVYPDQIAYRLRIRSKGGRVLL
jgi:hypothetical protein